jgi:hypothetical protein|tara:strand:+ start:191 stop:856 length:666 start_codon:yes stop_codon:yes gene_type:complete
MFKKNKYEVIKKAIPKELAIFLMNYLLMKKQVYDTCIEARYISPFETLLGKYEGETEQIPNTYYCYADIAMETLSLKIQPIMEKITGFKLNPSYTYARIYKKGDKLRKHKDRSSCEISATINLGGNPWPIYLDPTGADTVIDEFKEIHKPNSPPGKMVNLNIGDMLVYRGSELEHWRKEFKDTECVQGFLHYTNRKTKWNQNLIFDKRPHLGLPSWFCKNK